MVGGVRRFEVSVELGGVQSAPVFEIRKNAGTYTGISYDINWSQSYDGNRNNLIYVISY